MNLEGLRCACTAASVIMWLGVCPSQADTGQDNSASPAFASVLSAADAAAYRNIFSLQETARLAEADRLIARLKDKTLLGHVYAQRYLGTGYRSGYKELVEWLKAYGDHPQAPRIYALAKKRMPVGAVPPPAPADAPRKVTSEAIAQLGLDEESPEEFADTPAPALDESDVAEAPAEEEDTINNAISAPSEAPSKLSRAALRKVWERSLVAWRNKRFNEAARHFELVARAERADAWMRSGGYYWAARAHHAAGTPQRYVETMLLASQHPRTFYGILARSALGLDHGLNFQRPVLSSGDVQTLSRHRGVVRAIALAEIRQHDRADHELRVIAANAPVSSAAMIALAERLGAPSTALELASRALKVEGVAHDSALYPTMPWSGAAGEYSIDNALLHALVRQESGFRARAVSRVGARGLMQLMPATGKFIANQTNTKLGSRDNLYDPAVNMLLGQAYVAHLFRDSEIGPSLFKMAAAYNGGPGNLRRWEKRADHRDDPLLFIEGIPLKETREFVQRVLANMWIYRMRFGQPAPSLDALAAGDWPGYDPQSGSGVAARFTTN